MTEDAATRQAKKALDSPRYQQLLDALDLLADRGRDHPDQDGSAASWCGFGSVRISVG